MAKNTYKNADDFKREVINRIKAGSTSAKVSSAEKAVLEQQETTILLKQKRKKKKSELGDQWKFQFDIDYFYSFQTLINRDLNSSYFESNYFTNINSALSPVNSIKISPRIPEEYRLDAVTGFFNNGSPKEVIFYQEGNKLLLQETNLSDPKLNKTLFEDSTKYATKTLVHKGETRDYLVTVLVDHLNIGVEFYYFENGEKISVFPNPPTYFKHNIDGDGISNFKIVISELAQDKLELTVLLCSKNISPLQSNLIKIVLDLEVQDVQMLSNQIIQKNEGYEYWKKNMLNTAGTPGNVLHLFQVDGFIYLTRYENTNTIIFEALTWHSTNNKYISIWSYKYENQYNNTIYLTYDNNAFYVIYEHFLDDWQADSSRIDIFQKTVCGELRKESNPIILPAIPDQEEIYPAIFQAYMETVFTQGVLLIMINRNLKPYPYGKDIYNPRIDVFSFDLKMKTAQYHRTQESEELFCGTPIYLPSKYDIKTSSPKLHTISKAIEPVAILDAPPISNQITYPSFRDKDIYPSLTYTFEKKDSTEKNVKFQTSKSTSKKFGGKIGIFGSSIKAMITDSIKEETSKFHESKVTLSQSTSIKTQGQSMVVYIGIEYSIYEYPFLINGEIIGHFVFIVPGQQKRPNIIVDECRNLFSVSEHQVGEIFSYPFGMPERVNTGHLLYTAEFAVSGSGDTNIDLKYSSLKTNGSSTTTTTNLGKSKSMELEFPVMSNLAGSIEAAMEDTYEESELNLSSFTIENSFGLKIEISQLKKDESNRIFYIQPYFYTDQFNVIRCSYKVRVPEGQNFWKDTYNKPLLGMSMPYRTKPFANDAKYLYSFDIKTSPQELGQGSLPSKLEISAKIHNWSLVGADPGVVVSFYYAKNFQRNPTLKDLILIGSKTIKESILPRSSVDASIIWNEPYINEKDIAVPIYVRIDPDEKYEQVNRDYNFAQINFPLSSIRNGIGNQEMIELNNGFDKN